MTIGAIGAGQTVEQPSGTTRLTPQKSTALQTAAMQVDRLQSSVGKALRTTPGAIALGLGSGAALAVLPGIRSATAGKLFMRGVTGAVIGVPVVMAGRYASTRSEALQ